MKKFSLRDLFDIFGYRGFSLIPVIRKNNPKQIDVNLFAKDRFTVCLKEIGMSENAS